MKQRTLSAILYAAVWTGLGCIQTEQTVHIVAQDFRFSPPEIRLSSERPIRLVVTNEGREPHEFKSQLLAHQISTSGGGILDSLKVLPNQRAETVMHTIPGTYVYYCAIRGHAGMNGTIVVE